MTTDENRIVARWETKGKDWLELYHRRTGYWYRGNGCGGGLEATNDEDAIRDMEAPRGSEHGWGQAAVLKGDRPSLKRVFTAP